MSLAEAKRYSNYSSVAIEGWAVDEPKKYESDISQTLNFIETRDIIVNKIKDRFDYI